MKKNNYKAKVNDNFEFDNLSAKTLDIIPVEDNTFHILHEGKSYSAELVEANFKEKKLRLKINGSNYEVELSDQYDQLVKKMGLSANITHKVNSINAPMPGLVLDIMVEEGQDIAKGEPLLILEAMKMENVIKAPGEGKIKSIEVKKGTAVDKGQLLIDLGD